ncbi:MAG: glycoside hydrolase family 127 protein [Limisphaerales bacterium]
MEIASSGCRFFAGAFTAIFSFNLLAAGPPPPDYPIQPTPFTAVHLDDAFWAPRLETNRAVTIPYAFGQCKASGRMNNFERAAAVLRGENIENRKPPGFPFDDTDPYKVLEGASYTLAVHPDPKMSAYLDSLIALLAAAQEPDGYLYTTRTIDPKHPHPWAGTNRWVNDPALSHELYNAGHLFEAAAAHYQSTGKTNLLNVALKEANLLCQTFGPGPNQLHLWPGHEIVEMGLVRLYRITGDPRYLNLAKYFIAVRGSRPGGDDYHQSRIPPVEQTEAVGHAVRAGYLYSGMADVAALTGDPRYIRAIDAIWENATGKKLYLTGGIGSRAEGEAFGDNYELPNLTAYNETCAAVANIFWNERLFLLHGDARYVDVLERTLYNGLLSGVSLDGTKFFYSNPLESDGSHQRSPWFGCACCPGNITRFLPSLPGYFYAQSGDTIYVNLYAGSKAGFKLKNGRAVKITQETRYPWDGVVKMTVQLDWQKSMKFTINVRIPGWARNEVVPGGLYKFSDSVNEPVILTVNDEDMPVRPDQGYVSLDRAWKSGDVIELDLPMRIRHVAASENVVADRGRIALQRGPIVFCAEWPDTPNGKVRKLLLPDEQPLTTRFDPALLNGVQVIEGKGYNVTTNEFGHTVKRLQDFKVIPYFAWANRGPGEMIVWIPNSESVLRAP